MSILTTMKSTKHEILKEQWREMIKLQSESGLPVRKWCEENHISHGKYYYWLRVIREEALIKAGTLAVTGQTQFAEVKEPQKENDLHYSNTYAKVPGTPRLLSNERPYK